MVRLGVRPGHDAGSDTTHDADPVHRLKKRQRRSRALPTASDLYVPRLPGLPPDARLSLFAGLLPSTPTPSTSDAQLYFLLARNKHIPKRERLVIWLNGGPGCSSFDGALIELGPIKVNKDAETLRLVESTAWNEYANVLFLDQPAGTGFSYVTKDDDVRELPAAAEQVVMFLANFYKVFPEFSTMDTFIAGESYAGQYIPYIADAIEKTMVLPTRLQGLLIGNGWISPREQYPAYLTYLERRGFLRKGTQAHRTVQAAVQKCNATLAAMDARAAAAGGGARGKGMVLVPDCEAILGAMNAATMKEGKCLNSYDTREYLTCGTPWPHELAEVTQYLRRPDVIEALHATSVPHEWTHCSQPVASKFWTPNSVPSIALLPDLLQKMPILLYAGDQDLMCAGIGIEAAIAQMEWNGAKGFGDAKVLDWTVGEESAGRWTTARNLTYVEFTNSSHMVPLDKPLAAHDMLLRFMQVDTLHSAGSAARIPSRIGSEPALVLGATHPNGSTLSGAAGSGAGALDGSGSGSATDSSEEVGGETVAGDGGGAAFDKAGAGVDDSQLLAEGTTGGFDPEHERLYGPRRTVALVVLLVVLVGVVSGVVHWRKQQRRQRRRQRQQHSWKQERSAGGGGGRRGRRDGRRESTGGRVRLEDWSGVELLGGGGGGEERGDVTGEEGRADRDDDEVDGPSRGRSSTGYALVPAAEARPGLDPSEEETERRVRTDPLLLLQSGGRRPRPDDPEAWGDLGRTPDPQGGGDALAWTGGGGDAGGGGLTREGTGT